MQMGRRGGDMEEWRGVERCRDMEIWSGMERHGGTQRRGRGSPTSTCGA